MDGGWRRAESQGERCWQGGSSPARRAVSVVSLLWSHPLAFQTQAARRWFLAFYGHSTGLFQCEYRVFVLNRRPFACKHYRGNSLIFPDSRVVLEAIEAYSSSPIAYALDVGVTDRGDTLLVEINDGYSLGSYGLLPIAYARFIEARWKEFWGLPFEMNYPASFA